MTTTVEEPPAGPGPPAPETGETPEGEPSVGLTILRVLAGAALPIAAVALLWAGFNFLLNTDVNRLLLVLIAIAIGAGGVFLLFWAMNWTVDRLPERHREGVRPYVFVGPAVVLLAVFLIYPVVNTILISFGDRTGSGFVGLDNYEFVFTDESMLRAIRNTLGWIIIVPAVATAVGLAFATLADRLQRGEAVAKSLIFLPMAISFVGAAVTWSLIYGFRPEGFGSNVGLLNGVKQGLGMSPTPWLQEKPWNNLLLMVIMIWIQTGFAMVVLSAAIKSIPKEIIEAARIDGASELQVFRRITIPSIAPTIAVVVTYMVINAMKVFDIVFVIGSPDTNETEVIAERMIRNFFILDNDGRGAAIAVVLFVAIIPVMLWNIRRFREQEAMR